MTEKQFMNEVAQRLGTAQQTEGFDIRCQIFTKNNNTQRYGILLQKENEMVTPTIFLERYYQNYLQEQTSVDEVAHHIVDILEDVKSHARQYQSLSLQFTDCQDNIIYRLISKEMNEALCEEIPYIPFLDLMISFCVVVNYTDQGVETIKITNELMNQWGITTAELYQLAEENTPRIFPAKIQLLSELLQKQLNLQDEDEVEDELRVPMIILGNKAGVYGASTILYPGVVEELADKWNGNLYVLPSSVHEFIILPEQNENSLEELSAIVQHINKDYVIQEEILSNRAYFYNKDEKKFSY